MSRTRTQPKITVDNLAGKDGYLFMHGPTTVMTKYARPGEAFVPICPAPVEGEGMYLDDGEYVYGVRTPTGSLISWGRLVVTEDRAFHLGPGSQIT